MANFLDAGGNAATGRKARRGHRRMEAVILAVGLISTLAGCHSSPAGPANMGDLSHQLDRADSDEQKVDSIIQSSTCNTGPVLKPISDMPDWPSTWGSTEAGLSEPTDPLIYNYWATGQNVEFCSSATIAGVTKAGHRICETLGTSPPPFGEALWQDPVLVTIAVNDGGLAGQSAKFFPGDAVGAYCPDLSGGSTPGR